MQHTHGAYCRARARLPVDLVRTLTRYTGQWIAERTPQPWCWRGRAVRLKSTCTTVVADGDGTSAGANWVSKPCVHSTAFFAFMARLSALPLSVARGQSETSAA